GSLLRLAVVVACLARAEALIETDHEPDAILDERGPRRLRSLLLSLNRFPRVVSDTFDRRNPAHLVRYLEEVCDATAACMADGGFDSETSEAVAVIIRRCLRLLNIQIPPFT